MSQKTQRRKPRLNRRFRFQLLKNWIVEHYEKCRVADIGGGKGLLAYLLMMDGWTTAVIEPNKTKQLVKYKDFSLDKRVKLKMADWSKLKIIEQEFGSELVDNFDLLVGLHAHGVNMKIIDFCAQQKKDFVLLPCCVIDEPIEKQLNVNWFDSLVEYAGNCGFKPKTFQLNFKGRNKLLYSDKYFVKK